MMYAAIEWINRRFGAVVHVWRSLPGEAMDVRISLFLAALTRCVVLKQVRQFLLLKFGHENHNI